MAEHNEMGQRGEKVAQFFLAEKGYKILHVNWRNRKAEIDIIAMDGNTIVFVEVKTRQSNLYGDPENAVDFKKQKRIIHAANAYVTKYRIENDARFDIISILIEKTATVINHYTDAFYPTLEW
jgi:putative endonuclease